MNIRKAPLFLLLAVSLALIAATQMFAAPQSQQDSLADAARKAREQQKDQPKSPKVLTNEDIESIQGDISVVGNEDAPATGSDQSAAKVAKAEDKTQAAEAKDEAYWQKKFAEARRALADDSKELDVLQREYNLKQEQFYSNPDVAMREQTSRKDLNDTLDAINSKKDEVAKDNQVISDLEDALHKAGGDPGWARESEAKAQDSEEEAQASELDKLDDSDKSDKLDQPDKSDKADQDTAPASPAQPDNSQPESQSDGQQPQP